MGVLPRDPWMQFVAFIVEEEEVAPNWDCANEFDSGYGHESEVAARVEV